METLFHMDFMPDTARSVNINSGQPEHYTAKHGRENECNEYKSAERNHMRRIWVGRDRGRERDSSREAGQC